MLQAADYHFHERASCILRSLLKRDQEAFYCSIQPNSDLSILCTFAALLLILRVRWEADEIWSCHRWGFSYGILLGARRCNSIGRITPEYWYICARIYGVTSRKSVICTPHSAPHGKPNVTYKILHVCWRNLSKMVLLIMVHWYTDRITNSWISLVVLRHVDD